MYTSAKAMRDHEKQNKATYLNVALFCGFAGGNILDAKKYLENLAKKDGLKVSDYFDGFNECEIAYMSDMRLGGFFDF